MLASILIIALVLVSFRLKLGLAAQIFIAATRTVIQLWLIGLVLHVLFRQVNLLWISLIAFVMLSAAGREVMMRQQHRFSGWWGFGVGTLAMFVSSFSVTVLALVFIIKQQATPLPEFAIPIIGDLFPQAIAPPWYTPQYAIPLLGMLLGNTMNGIAIGLDRLTHSAWNQRNIIENKLMLGHTWSEAINDLRRESIRSGLIPIINAMAAAGLVSLPGMMTGQLLHGAAPMDAVKYQILIMFLIAGGTGFGVYLAVWAASRHLFDDRQRLRLSRLKIKE